MALSNVCRPLPVVNRGRDAKGLPLRPAPAPARLAFGMTVGCTPLPRWRDCISAWSSGRAGLSLRGCASALRASAFAVGLPAFSENGSAVVECSSAWSGVLTSALVGELCSCIALGATLDAGVNGSVLSGSSDGLLYRAMPRPEAPNAYRPGRLLYMPSTSLSPRRLPLPCSAGSSLHGCLLVRQRSPGVTLHSVPLMLGFRTRVAPRVYKTEYHGGAYARCWHLNKVLWLCGRPPEVYTLAPAPVGHTYVAYKHRWIQSQLSKRQLEVCHAICKPQATSTLCIC